jgi:hypothetical protein
MLFVRHIGSQWSQHNLYIFMPKYLWLFWNVLFRNYSSFEKNSNFVCCQMFSEEFKILKMPLTEYQILFAFSALCVIFVHLVSISPVA